MSKRHSAFRRTRRAAIAVGAVTLATFVATSPGGAAPQQEEFNSGTGSAIALGYKVNPTNGNLSFGITAGESVAGHQNTGATGQSRAVNLGVIGVTLGGEACDGGDPTLPAEKQPQPVIVNSTDENAAEGRHESEQGLVDKFARATAAPYAEAITTITPLGDPAAIYVDGGRAISHSGVVEDGVREAFARTELGSIVIAGGAVEIKNLAWEAVHRSGAVEETLGRFTIGNVIVGGQELPLPSDGLEQFAALNEALKPLGITITAPKVRVEQGIVFVDPLKVGIVQSAERDSVVGQLFGKQGIQPVREQITKALLEADCSNASYITIADVVLGTFSGAGALTLELGGVQATTAEINAFQFGPLPALPSLPPLLDGSGTPSLSSTPPASLAPSSPTAAAAPETAAAPDGSSSDTNLDTEPIADLAGARGGWMALVGGGGLAALLATAEADRRKMRHALREIPLEA